VTNIEASREEKVFFQAAFAGFPTRENITAGIKTPRWL
jgi:hypothetical protein